MAIRVTVWNEYHHEKTDEVTAAIYPEGIHNAIAGFLKKESDFVVRTATLDEPEHGLTQDVLDSTDVLLWWGHVKHHQVADEVAERVKKRVLQGMGFIALHSAHMSKPFMSLMGTSCTLRWHEEGEKERIWVIEPGHPIAKGLPPYFEIPQDEMYGERFDIPAPESLVFVTWFKTGEVFRSGCCFTRNYGRIFYFQPGHETFPVYHDANVQKVLVNAVRWAKSDFLGEPVVNGDWVPCLEPVE